MVKLYVDLEKALGKADADMQAAIISRNGFEPGSDDFKYWAAIAEAHRAMALSLSQSMDNLLLAGGARFVIDNFNNGLYTLKETVDALKAIEAELSL